MKKFFCCCAALVAFLVSGITHTQAAVTMAPAAAMQNYNHYMSGITNTLMTYPTQAREILDYYVGVDTSKIDFDKFSEIISRGDYNEIYQEVSTLYNNRVAFNNGTFTDISYYKPVNIPPPSIKPTPITGTAAAGAGTSLTTVGFYAGAVALTGGLAAATFVGSGPDVDSGGGSSVLDITFGRDSLPYLQDPNTFLDAEMAAYPLNGLQRINAHHAYGRGLTGAGVKIGFFDWFDRDETALDAVFGNRVIYTDLNIAVDCADAGTDCDHGVMVMEAAAGQRGDSGSFGVAYNASLLAKSVYADFPFITDARSLVDQGANIVNLSCSGCATYSDLEYMTDNGAFVTIATGNDDGASEPLFPASFAEDFDYKVLAVTGIVDIVGGVPTPDAYNHCGSQKEYCLAAYTPNGTSFSAPQVAGAAALLKEGWSFLTAKQIGQILLYSATDIGAAGVDNVFGHGLLNLKAATEPLGSSGMMSGMGVPINYTPSSISQNANTPFGNAFTASGNANGNIVIIDSFGRDFAVKADEHLAVSDMPTFTPQTVKTFGSKQPQLKKMQLSDQLSMQFNSQQNVNGTSDVIGFAEYKIAPQAQVKLGFTTSMDSMPDSSEQKFNKFNFISPDVFGNGFLNFSDNNQIMYQEIKLGNDHGISTKFRTIYSKNNYMEGFDTVQNQFTSDYTSNIVETSYAAFDDLNVKVKGGVTHEFDSLLGTQFSGAFDMANGANTYFTGLDVSYDIMSDLNISASYNRGVTKTTPTASSSFSDVSNIETDSFFVTATKNDLTRNDSLSFSVGQPTRVISGNAKGITQTVDRNTGNVSVTGFEQSLVPTGQTLLFQAAYEKTINDNVSFNFAVEYESEPNHQADRDDEASTLMKVIYRFN